MASSALPGHTRVARGAYGRAASRPPFRLPAAIAVGAILLASVLAVSPEAEAVVSRGPGVWVGLLFFPVLVGYLLATLAGVMHVIWLAAVTARPGTVEAAARPDELPAPPHPAVHVVAALCLAALVALEGASHLGENSGAWRTSRPVDERDNASADGHVFFIDGQPVQEDSQFFIGGAGILTGRLSPDLYSGWIRSGRGAYVFLVGLVARVTAPFGTTYPAFVAVNLLAWLGATLALYDLGRVACRSVWGGLLAGALTATGIGFTFTAGAAVANVAGYGAVAVVFWLMWRLRALLPGSGLREDLIAGSVAGTLALVNSLTPVFLLFVGMYYVGRAELRRILTWVSGLAVVVVIWGRLLDLAARGDAVYVTVSEVAHVLAPVLALAVLCALIHRAGQWVNRVIAIVALASLGSLASVSWLAPSAMQGPLDRLYTVAHLPEYLLDAGGALGVFKVLFTPSPEAAWQFGANVFAAFPAGIWALAALGAFGIPRRWVEWCAAAAVSSGLVTFGMNALSASNHPRLMYLAFPGVYILAAGGLLIVYRLVACTAGSLWPFGRFMPMVAGAVVVLCLVIATSIPANAGLMGNSWFDEQFHWLSQL